MLYALFGGKKMLKANDTQRSSLLRRALGPAGRSYRTIGRFALLLVLLLAGSLVQAQTTNATVTGTITDASGAVMPGVKVKVTNTDTGEVRSGTTSTAGYFSIPALPPGPYTLDASSTGFDSKNTAVVLSVGQTLTVNLSLKVGNATEKVDVVASGTVALETEDHALTGVMDAKTVEELPSNGSYRNATFYAQTTGVGVQPGSQLGDTNIGSNVSQYNLQSNQLFIGGQGFWSTTYLLDGVVDMSYFGQTATVETPPEGTQEVQVIRNSANARYDGAAAVNALTKNGTRNLHGRLYDYLQNNALNARGEAAGPTTLLRYNLFGGNVGWKVPFTHEKVYFFFDYQGFRDHTISFLQAFVPTAAERAGDFSADLTANAGTKQPATTIYDPTTFNPALTPNGGAAALQPFSFGGKSNVIDPARLSPLAMAYLNAVYPLPNGQNTTAGDNYGSQHSKTQFLHDDYLGRLDYNISDKDHIWTAYDTNNPQIVRPEQWDNDGIQNTKEYNQLFGTDFYIEESHVFTPNVVNTARIGFARSVTAQQFAQIDNGTNYVAKFGLTGLNPPPSVWGLPAFNPGSPFTGPSGSPLSATQNMYEYSDEIDWVKGKHSLFVGAEVDDIDYNAVWYTGNPNGALGTNGEYTYNGSSGAAWQQPGQWVLGKVSQMPAANVLADYMLGYYNSTNATAGSQVGYFHQHNFMPYFQDDWHLRPNLTVNLGIRYDYYSSPTEQYGHAGYLDPATGKFTEAPYDSNKFNFSPRAGFAYAIDHKTTVHGGGGLYYYQFGYYDLQGMTTDPLFNTGLNSTQTQTQPVIWPATNSTGNPDISGSAPGKQEFFTLANAESIWASMPAPTGVFVPGSLAFAKHMPTSYSEQWNLAVQRTFGENWLLTVDYIGSSDHHIFGYSNINLASLPTSADVNPSSTADINSRRPYQAVQGSIMQQHKWGQSHYNGMEVELKHQFAHGFQFNTNYTWQKSMDYQDSDHSISGLQGLNPKIDYGRSDFVQPYVFKVSGIYELPFGKGKMFLNGGNWWENQLGGWRFSGFVSVQGGFPFDITATDTSNTGGGIRMRAQESCNSNSGPKTFAQYINISCFTQPSTNTFGNERRNDLTGPRNTNVDLAGFKEFAIWNNLKFQFRADAYSALNHPLPKEPVNTLSSGTFGSITGWGGARTLQLGAKLLW